MIFNNYCFKNNYKNSLDFNAFLNDITLSQFDNLDFLDLKIACFCLL